MIGGNLERTHKYNL